MSIRPQISTATFAVFAVFAVLALSACSTDRPTPVSVSDLSEDRPDQESWDVEYYLGENGVTRAIMRAPHMARYDAKDSVLVVLTGTDEIPVHVDVRGADGQTSDVSATEIRYYEERRLYNLTGDVVLATSNGRTLKGDQLVWDEPGHRLRSDGFVSIVADDRTLQGYGLDADELLEDFTLHRVTGRFYVEDDVEDE